MSAPKNKIRPLTMTYKVTPPRPELLWLEVSRFIPEDGKTVLLAWPRGKGFTFRTGRHVGIKWQLSDDTVPREAPTFFSELK